MKKIIWLVSILSLVSACKSDPYDGTATDQLKKAGEKVIPTTTTSTSTTTTTTTSTTTTTTTTSTTTTTTMPAPISLVLPDVLAVNELETVLIPIRAFVPAPGRAEFQFVGMPDGMIHNTVKSRLEWTPDAKAANDPNNANVTTKNYVLYVSLRSSLDPIRTITKTVVISVIDKKVQPFSKWQLLEADEYQAVYQRCDFEGCEQLIQPVRGQLR